MQTESLPVYDDMEVFQCAYQRENLQLARIPLLFFFPRLSREVRYNPFLPIDVLVNVTPNPELRTIGTYHDWVFIIDVPHSLVDGNLILQEFPRQVVLGSWAAAVRLRRQVVEAGRLLAARLNVSSAPIH